MPDAAAEIDGLKDVRAELVLALARVERSAVIPPNVRDGLVEANRGRIDRVDALISALKVRPTERALYVVRNFLDQWRTDELDSRMYGGVCDEAIPAIDIPEV